MPCLFPHLKDQATQQIPCELKLGAQAPALKAARDGICVVLGKAPRLRHCRRYSGKKSPQITTTAAWPLAVPSKAAKRRLIERNQELV
jgi:hypothetical protein